MANALFNNLHKICALLVVTSLACSLISSLDCDFVRVHLLVQPSLGPFAVLEHDNWLGSNFATNGIGIGLLSFESPTGLQCLSYSYVRDMPGGVTGTIESYRRWFDDVGWSVIRSCATCACLFGLISNYIVWNIFVSHITGRRFDNETNYYKKSMIALLLILVLQTIFESFKYGMFLAIDVCTKSVWVASIPKSLNNTSVDNEHSINNNRIPSTNIDIGQTLGITGTFDTKNAEEIIKFSAGKCSLSRGGIYCFVAIVTDVLLVFLLILKFFICNDEGFNENNDKHNMSIIAGDETRSTGLNSFDATENWTTGTRSIISNPTIEMIESNSPPKSREIAVDDNNIDAWTMGTKSLIQPPQSPIKRSNKSDYNKIERIDENDEEDQDSIPWRMGKNDSKLPPSNRHLAKKSSGLSENSRECSSSRGNLSGKSLGSRKNSGNRSNRSGNRPRRRSSTSDIRDRRQHEDHAHQQQRRDANIPNVIYSENSPKNSSVQDTYESFARRPTSAVRTTTSSHSSRSSNNKRKNMDRRNTVGSDSQEQNNSRNRLTNISSRRSTYPNVVETNNNSSSSHQGTNYRPSRRGPPPPPPQPDPIARQETNIPRIIIPDDHDDGNTVSVITNPRFFRRDRD